MYTASGDTVRTPGQDTMPAKETLDTKNYCDSPSCNFKKMPISGRGAETGEPAFKVNLKARVGYEQTIQVSAEMGRA